MNTLTIDLPTSRHANKRMQQRSIDPADASVIALYGDLASNVGDHIVSLSISRGAAQELVADGILSADHATRLARLSVLVAHDSPNIVTALWRIGNRGRRYSKQYS